MPFSPLTRLNLILLHVQPPIRWKTKEGGMFRSSVLDNFMLLLVAVLPKGTFFGRGELGWFEGARERKPIHPVAKASKQAGKAKAE